MPMKISNIIDTLENFASPALQESYDNAGLIVGTGDWECTGVICALDSTVAVVDEAIAKKCNLIVAHHPIIFSGLKKITGKDYVQQAIIKAIKNDIAIYAIHTNLDNVMSGVSGKMSSLLGLTNTAVLAPKAGELSKMFCFVPTTHAAALRDALFEAGAGQIGNYSECSFNSEGSGTFKAGPGTNPFTGKEGERHTESELKIEVIFPSWATKDIVRAILKSHPYEEPAYDIVKLANEWASAGAGIIGDLPEEMPALEFLARLKSVFKLKVIKHTRLPDRPIKKIALCGGAGSFLVSKALAAGADCYITGDMKYHEFFDANDRMVIADIGHYESEQFTIDLLHDILKEKFRTFAILKTEVETNPVHYFS
jgi:dinuclear metal center YbgI/SA1388 family protein